MNRNLFEALNKAEEEGINVLLVPLCQAIIENTSINTGNSFRLVSFCRENGILDIAKLRAELKNFCRIEDEREEFLIRFELKGE